MIAGDADDEERIFRTDILLNFEWIRTKVQACGVADTLNDYGVYEQRFKPNRSVARVAQVRV